MIDRMSFGLKLGLFFGLFSAQLTHAETPQSPSKACAFILNKWNAHLEKRGRIYKLYNSDLVPIRELSPIKNFQSVRAAVSDFNRNRGEFQWTLVDDNESGLMIRQPTELIGKHIHGVLKKEEGGFNHISGIVADVSFGNNYEKTRIAIKTKSGLQRVSLKELELIHRLDIKKQTKEARKKLKPKLSEKAFKIQGAVEMKLNNYLHELNEYGMIRLFFKKDEETKQILPQRLRHLNIFGKKVKTPEAFFKVETIHGGWRFSKEFLSLNPIKHVALWKHIIRNEKAGELIYPTPFNFLVKNTFDRIYKSSLSAAQKKSLEIFGDSLPASVKEFLKSKLDVSTPLKLAIAFIAFQYAYESIVEALQEERVEKTKEAIYQNEGYWLDLLDNDPLYKRIAEQYQEGRISKRTAIEDVFLRRQALEFYTSLRNDLKIPMGEELLWHVMNDEHISPLFPATIYHMTNGSQDSAQMSFESTDHISKTKGIELLKTNEVLLRQRSLIYTIFDDPVHTSELLKNKANNSAYNKLLEITEVSKLLRMYRTGEITKKEAKKSLLELAQIQEMVERWKIIGAQREDLSKNKDIYSIWWEHRHDKEKVKMLLSAETFPHEEISFNSLINKPASSTVGSLYFLRFTAPALRQHLLRVYSYSRRLTKGRVKNAAKDASKAQSVIDKSGNVKQVKIPASLTSKALGFLGSGVIAAEVLVRTSHIKNADKMVKALEDIPHLDTSD